MNPTPKSQHKHCVAFSCVHLFFMLVFAIALLPQNLYAQTPVESQTTLKSTWQKVPETVQTELDKLTDKLEKLFSAEGSAIVSAILAASSIASKEAGNQMINERAVADVTTDANITIASNVAKLEASEKTQPRASDCQIIAAAKNNDTGVVTQTVLAADSKTKNVTATSGAQSTQPYTNFEAHMNGAYGPAYTFAAVYSLLPKGFANTPDTIKFRVPETGQILNVGINTRVNALPGAALLDVATSFVTPGTIRIMPFGDGSELGRVRDVQLQLLCGGAPPPGNTEGQSSTVAGLNALPIKVAGAMRNNLCRDYLSRLYNQRLPSMGADSGQLAIGREVSKYDEKEINGPNGDGIKKQIAMKVGTSGALSQSKWLELMVDYYQSAKFLEDAAADPDGMQKRQLQLMGMNLMLDNAIANETQWQGTMKAINIGRGS